jgi:hypothetical protein
VNARQLTDSVQEPDWPPPEQVAAILNGLIVMFVPMARVFAMSQDA